MIRLSQCDAFILYYFTRLTSCCVKMVIIAQKILSRIASEVKFVVA